MGVGAGKHGSGSSAGFQYLSEYSAPYMRLLENPNTELYSIFDLYSGVENAHLEASSVISAVETTAISNPQS